MGRRGMAGSIPVWRRVMCMRVTPRMAAPRQATQDGKYEPNNSKLMGGWCWVGKVSGG